MGTISIGLLPAVCVLSLRTVSGSSDSVVGARNHSKSYEEAGPLCQREELRLSSCLVGRLRCYNKRDCGGQYMLMKLICSGSSNQSLSGYDYPEWVSSNRSLSGHDYPECGDGGSEASLLVSPLVVAGIVIGLVLLLSCVTIIVGSLRKDSRLRNPHLRASYAPDGFSYGGSIGELRSTCIEEFPPAFDFDSYVETLSQINAMYPDSPPCYDECVGPGATQIYIPTDDPPPYSVTDPCQGREEEGALQRQGLQSYLDMGAETSGGGGASWVAAGGASHYPTDGLYQQPIASISLSTLPMEEAPPYEAVVGGGGSSQTNQPIPLIPMDLLKHSGEESRDSPQHTPVSHRIL